MFTINAYPKADYRHQVKQTAATVELLDKWKEAYKNNGWIVESTSYAEATDQYVCSACTWRGDYPIENGSLLLCPSCESGVRMRSNYTKGIK